MITKDELNTAQSLAPLLSEGAISPFQVSNMSKREKATREKNIQIRYKMEEEFKRQNMTDEEKQKELREDIETDIINIRAKMNAKQFSISYLKGLPAFQSKRMNNTRRGVLFEENAVKKDKLKIKELQGRLKNAI